MTEKKALNNNTVVQNNVDNPLLAEKIQKCPECGSKNIITDDERAEMYCANCGTVIAENIVDPGPEWHVYDSGQRGRIRAEPTGNILGTPYKKIPGLRMQGKIQIGNTTPSSEQSLLKAYAETNRICSALGFSKAIGDEAKELCRKAQKEKIFKGSGGVYRCVSAIVLIVCRRQRIPILIKEISDVSHNEKVAKILEKSKMIETRLTLKKTFNDNNPIKFLPKFCSKLGLSKQVENLAKEIIRIAKEQNLTNGRRPNNVAAAAICIAEAKIGSPKEIWEISKISGADKKTINKRINELIGNESIVSFLDEI